MSTLAVASRRRGSWSRLRWLLGRAWAMEIHGYQSIFRFVFRRPRVPAGSVGFTYSAPILSILIVFTVVSAVELVVVDLIVHRWGAGAPAAAADPRRVGTDLARRPAAGGADPTARGRPGRRAGALRRRRRHPGVLGGRLLGGSASTHPEGWRTGAWARNRRRRVGHRPRPGSAARPISRSCSSTTSRCGRPAVRRSSVGSPRSTPTIRSVPGQGTMTTSAEPDAPVSRGHPSAEGGAPVRAWPITSWCTSEVPS